VPKTELTKTENHELALGGEENLASFFVPGEIGRAFKVSEWTVQDMIQTLVEIAQDTELGPRDRMAAIRMLDGKAKEGMLLGGMIHEERLNLRRSLPDGTEAEYNAEGMRLVKDGSDRLQNTLALLEEGAGSTEIIDVEIENASELRGAGGVPRTTREPPSDGTGGSGGGDGGSTGPTPGDGSKGYAEQRTGPPDAPTQGTEDNDESGVQAAGGGGAGWPEPGDEPGGRPGVPVEPPNKSDRKAPRPFVPGPRPRSGDPSDARARLRGIIDRITDRDGDGSGTHGPGEGREA
jgi:hypothetical protein